MEFMREDGIIYDPQHKDTIKRLLKSDRFKQVENINVDELKSYAKARNITGYSSMTRDELIETLKGGG